MQPFTVQQVDFLPATLREVCDQRRHRVLYASALALLASGLATAAIVQHHIRGSVVMELETLKPRHDEATAASNRLAQLQSRLKAENSTATLLTYLRHRWPRTQVLAAVFKPLPDSIMLSELKVSREIIPPTAAEESQRHVAKVRGNVKDELAKLPPTERDLARLRGDCDQQRTVVQLVGTTTEGEALHRYIGELAESDLVAKVELSSIESKPEDAKDDVAKRRSSFHARVILRPGYGQPGGPNPTSKTVASAPSKLNP